MTLCNMFDSIHWLLSFFLFIAQTQPVRAPPSIKIRPAVINGIVYDFKQSYMIPQTMGPIKHPIPLNNCKRPNVVAKTLTPNISTNTVGIATMYDATLSPQNISTIRQDVQLLQKGNRITHNPRELLKRNNIVIGELH